MKNLLKLSTKDEAGLQSAQNENLSKAFYNRENAALNLVKRIFEAAFLKTAFLLFFTFQIGFGQNNSELPTSIREDGALPNANAILDLQGSKKGLLIPRLSQADMNSMPTPIVESMLVYNTSLDRFQYFNGSAWVNISPRETIIDFDNDTYVTVEANNDKDVIDFYVENNLGYSLTRTSAGYSQLDNNDGNRMQIGRGAGQLNTGAGNVFVGPDAGNKNVSGFGLTYLGREAGQNATGANNTMVGSRTGKNTSTGFNNTLIGTSAGIDLGTGNSNTMIGAFSGENNSGTNNIFLGSGSGFNETGSNKLIIEPSSSASPLIYGDFSSNYVRINGQLEIGNSSSNTTSYAFPTTDGNAGEVMTTNGSGNLSWGSPSKTKTVHINQYAFQNANPTFGLISDPGLEGVYLNTGNSSGSQSMHANALIPEGSTITNIKVVYKDNSSSNLNISIDAENAMLNTFQTIFSFTTGGASSSRQTLNPGNFSYTVPSDFSIYISVRNSSGPWSFNMSIYDVIITYQEN